MGNQVVIQEKPIHEQIRDQRRNIDRSIRNIEREKRRVEAEEKKTKREIKKMAANNQLKAVRMMARDIVRMRNQITKMNEFCGQLKAVSLRIGSISTINEFSNAMEEAANAIITVSGNLDTQKLAQMAKTMMKEDAKLDMRQEMMQEVLEGIGEGMDDPLQQDQIYKQILEELNINIEGELPIANIKTQNVNVKQDQKEKAESDSLDFMLKQLLKNP